MSERTEAGMPDHATELRAKVELALNLNRIYAVVRAYPQISQIPIAGAASLDDVLAGYERIKQNRHLGPMCEQGESRVRRENARIIEALCELVTPDVPVPESPEERHHRQLHDGELNQMPPEHE